MTVEYDGNTAYVRVKLSDLYDAMVNNQTRAKLRLKKLAQNEMETITTPRTLAEWEVWERRNNRRHPKIGRPRKITPTGGTCKS